MANARNALYFPHINVPSTAWTTRTILYWDKLSSIVPMHYLEDPELFDPTTRLLLTEGLIEPVMPGEFLYGREDFDRNFVNWVDEQNWRRLDETTAASTMPNLGLIHAEKLSTIPDYLVERGLAIRAEWPWYKMDVRLANAFMAYLAAVLGADPAVNATPITDSLGMATALGKIPVLKEAGESIHRTKARKAVLNAMLPVPVGPLDMTKLIRFKDKHGHMLPALRGRIEAHCSIIARIPTADEREIATEAFIRDCKDHVDEITAAMKPSFSRVMLGSLTPLFGAGLSLSSTDAGSTVAYAGNTLALAGAAYQAIASLHGPRIAAEAKPLAYFAHARQSLFRPQSWGKRLLERIHG